MCDDGVNMVWGIPYTVTIFEREDDGRSGSSGTWNRFNRTHVRRISPGTGRIRSPMVHSPFVPALPPIGGRPPTSTTWKTSTSSWTSPERARASAAESACNSCVSFAVNVSNGGAGTRRAAERVRRRAARDSRSWRNRSRSESKKKKKGGGRVKRRPCMNTMG